MARRGREQITVRLENEVLEELRPLARTERGRAGGLSFYLRRLIYQDLGRPLPEQYGREAEAAWSPRLATRLEHWLEADPDEREELLEAARLLGSRVGVEFVDSQELARLRQAAGETERLRKELKARAAPAPARDSVAGGTFEEGRILGLRQAADGAGSVRFQRVQDRAFRDGPPAVAALHQVDQGRAHLLERPESLLEVRELLHGAGAHRGRAGGPVGGLEQVGDLRECEAEVARAAVKRSRRAVSPE